MLSRRVQDISSTTLGGFLPEATPNGSGVLVQGRKFRKFPPFPRFRWFHSDRILQDVKQRTLWLRSWEEKGKARWWISIGFVVFFLYFFRLRLVDLDLDNLRLSWKIGHRLAGRNIIKRLRRHRAVQVPVCFSMSSFFKPSGPELVHLVTHPDMCSSEIRESKVS